jgi:uroporphyrinogen decarboxylase
MSTFLNAAYQKNTEQIPVWFMRQAGRSLPGYRELRKKYGVLELTQNSELAAKVSQEPVDLLGVDAAVLFADIMLLPIALGVKVRIVDAVGPIIDEPIRSRAMIDALPPLDPAKIEYLKATIRILRKELSVPVIGFSAAPFTLASYLIEGEPTRKWTTTKRFMYEHPEDWNALMKHFTDAIILYLEEQVDAGAQALQIFDSWVGCLSVNDYRTYVLPHVARIFTAIAPLGVPRIHFGTDTAALMQYFASVDTEVIGLDWRVDIPWAASMIGKKAIQGNLDPVMVLADERTMLAEAKRVIDSVPDTKGFIFNLGHGVMPESDDRQLRALVDFVHAYARTN